MQTSYSSDTSRFNAVVNCDQNASTSFVFSRKNSTSYCRPTCDSHPPISAPSDLAYFSTPDIAKQNGLKPCVACNPDLPIQIDNSIIRQTVNSVNAFLQIDIPDKSEHSSESASLTPQSPASPPKPYRHNRSSSLATCQEHDENDWRPRRASIANGHISTVAAAVEEISKSNGPSKREDRHRGEGDHARLVNEACMHIAAAAAAAAAQAVTSTKDQEPSKKGRTPSRASSADRTKQMFKTQRKKRRGGILGFKELAAKAGLSPWHFHRVFRSVTGLTPKAYGDACWNTVTSTISPTTLLAQNQKQPIKPPPVAASPESSPESTNSLLSSPPGDKPTSLDINSCVPKRNHQSQQPPQQQQLPQLPRQPHVQQPLQEQQSQQLPFVSSPFDDHINFDSANSLYSSQSLDSLVSSASESTEVMDSWSIPVTSYMDNSMAHSMSGFDMMSGWDDKPMTINELMATDFKLEPTLSMMNLGSELPTTSSGFYELALTTSSSQTPVEESFRPKSRLQKVKSGLGEPLFDNHIGYPSIAAAMLPGGMQTPTEPWMASPQPLLIEGCSDTVPPLFT